MAITIHQVPPLFSSAGQPLDYTFSSDKTNQPNFCFIVNIILNNVSVGISKVFPEKGNLSHYDISEIVQRKLNNRVPFPTALFTNAIDVANVNIIVFEMYGSPSSLQHSAASSITRVFNSSVNNFNFADYKGSIFLSSNPTRTWNMYRMLSSREVYSQELTCYLSLFADANASVYVTVFDKNEDAIGDYEERNASIFSIINLNLSIRLLGRMGINLDEVSRLEVIVNQSEVANIDFIDICDDVYTLIWINEFGRFESYCFYHNLINLSTVKSQNFERQAGEFSDLGERYERNENYNGTQKFATITEYSGTIHSQTLSAEMANWLQNQIASSPCVFIQDKTGARKSINVTNTKLTEKQEIYDDNINIQIDFDYSNKSKSVVL